MPFKTATSGYLHARHPTHRNSYQSIDTSRIERKRISGARKDVSLGFQALSNQATPKNVVVGSRSRKAGIGVNNYLNVPHRTNQLKKRYSSTNLNQNHRENAHKIVTENSAKIIKPFACQHAPKIVKSSRLSYQNPWTRSRYSQKVSRDFIFLAQF